MNNQTILIVGIVVVAAGAIIYYTYTQNNVLTQRLQSQEDIITSMRVRFDNMESIFIRPPEAEIESIFEKRVAEPYKRRTDEMKECVGDVCTFTPFKSKHRGGESIHSKPPRLEPSITEEAEERKGDRSSAVSISSTLSNQELDEIAEKELAAMMDERK